MRPSSYRGHQNLPLWPRIQIIYSLQSREGYKMNESFTYVTSVGQLWSRS
jgi:hypothetical protein